MTYTIIDHGVWNGYTPPTLPEWAKMASSLGGSIVFFKRESDETDFYEWIKSTPFESDSVVAQTMVEGSDSDAETVKAVFRDPSMLQPFNQRIIEIRGVDPNETKPHNLFAWLTYHPGTHSFSGEPVVPTPPPAPVLTYKKDVWMRATDDEAHTIEEVLAQQPIRKQKIFSEAQFLSHSDELFAELHAGFVAAFGQERAEELLAAS